MIDTDLPVGHAEQAFSDDGRLTDIELRDRYVEILDELVALAEQVGDGSPQPQDSDARSLILEWGRGRHAPLA